MNGLLGLLCNLLGFVLLVVVVAVVVSAVAS